MSRTAAILATILATVLALLAGPALAQGTAPSVHPGTKLNFAPTLGTAKLEHSTATPAAAGHGVGYTYTYSVGKMQITVDVFDGGRRVPSGTSNPTVATQFDSEATAAEQQIKAAGYTSFERPTVPSTCTYGAVAFRCLVYSASTGGTRLYSKLLMTGYHDNFVKISIIWSIGTGQTLNDADQALNSFIPALMH
ncbi:MAG: hypothetical protein JSR24_03720 [Proteobacteria bacterium]|nr:hypothetical protein [Pseudomonadota bacterium]